MNRTWLIALIAVVAVLAVYFLWVTPNSPQGELAEQPGQQNEAGVQQRQNRGDLNVQWRSSGHATVVEGTVRDGCAKCHTEQGFINPEIKAEDIKDPKGQTCNACHDFSNADNENKLRVVKATALPNKVIVDRGDSNLCITCHNSRRNLNDEGTRTGRSAPHGSPQADMLAGTNAWEFGADAVGYQNTAHAGIEDPCVTCHMALAPLEGEPGFNEVGGHTWRVRNDKAFNRNACIDCHPEVESPNRPAYDDYDGDGTLEGIQSETEGLMELVKAEIEKRIDGGKGGKLEESHGKVEFLKADGKTVIPAEQMDEKLYLASYNYFFVHSDGSRGVHNPPYAVTLLQQSYKALTGSDVPGAAIRR